MAFQVLSFKINYLLSRTIAQATWRQEQMDDNFQTKKRQEISGKFENSNRSVSKHLQLNFKVANQIERTFLLLYVLKSGEVFPF